MSLITNAFRSVIGGLVINTLLAVVKILGGVIGNSYALIADGIESALDIFSSLVVLGGLKVAAIPPDKNHPYGHGKAESLAAMVVAMGLIAAAIGIAIVSIVEIRTPHHMPAAFTLVILVGVIVIKEFLYRRSRAAASELQSTSVHADAWHHRSDAITSAAAFLGISIALVGGPGFESADDIAALFASGIITFNGYRIFTHALHEIMDRTVEPDLEMQVRNLASNVKGVHAVEKCRVRKNGLQLLVDIHVEVDPAISVHDGHEIAREVRRSLCQSSLRIGDVLVHVEPARRPPASPPLSNESLN